MRTGIYFRDLEMRVTGRSVLFSIIFLFCFFGSNLAQVYPDNEIDSLLSKGITFVINQDYEKANEIFSGLAEEYPDLPIGNIFLAGTSMSRSYDLGVPFESSLIDSLLAESVNQSEAYLDENSEDTWLNYFAGLSYGFKGYSDALKENYIDAFVNGLSSLQYFDKCISIDPRFHEAKIVIGTYLYWKADKTLDMSWLPFVDDDKEIGIKLLHSAADSANYLNHFAHYSLMWIYYNEEDYEEAAKIAEDFLLSHSYSRPFMLGLAKSLRFINKYKSLEVFSNLLNSYRLLNDNNHVQEILILKMMAELRMELNLLDEAYKTCDSAIRLGDKLDDYAYKQSLSRLEAIKEMQNSIKGQIKGN